VWFNRIAQGGIRFTQVIAAAGARWGGPLDRGGRPRPPAGKPARGAGSGRGWSHHVPPQIAPT
jgi:hypothetical protein